MRIAYFTNQYARASDTFIRNEVHELRARGHEVLTYAIRRPAEAGVPGEEVTRERGSTRYILSVPRVRLAATIARMTLQRPGACLAAFVLAMRISPDGIRSRVMNLFYLLEAIFLAAELRRLDVQILHNHIAENSATVAMLASGISGVPFSMTVHGPGIFFHPDAWALREKIARAAFTACISEFCKSQCMLHSNRSDWARLKVVRCGVGRQFEGVVASPPSSEPRLLFVGRLCDEKGLPLLLEAVARLVSGGSDCRLAIIGDGPLKDEVQLFIRQRGLDASIELLGWRGSDEIVEALEATRALVLPSFAEGLPVVIMESMALGRPVVSTAIAGIPELVESGVSGWLVAAGSVDALTRALAEALAASPETIAAMGIAGTRAVRERHSMTSEVDKLESLLHWAVRPVSPNARQNAPSATFASTTDSH